MSSEHRVAPIVVKMTSLLKLPVEILEIIAIRAQSLELAYLIESEYAGMHICL